PRLRLSGCNEKAIVLWNGWAGLEADGKPDPEARNVVAGLVAQHQAGAGNDDVVLARVELEAGAERMKVVEAERALEIPIEARIRVLQHVTERPLEHREARRRAVTRP